MAVLEDMQGVFKKVWLIIVIGIMTWLQSGAQIDTSGMEKMKSGIYYKLTEGHLGSTPQIGDHLVVDIVKLSEEGEVLFDTKALEHMQGVEIVLEEAKYNGDITEIFFKMKKGMLASLFILMDSVDREFLSEEDKGKYYNYEITLHDFTTDKVYLKEEFKHNKRQLKLDHKALKKLIKSSSFVAWTSKPR